MHFGPLYCDTTLAMSLNTWSNLVIIGFGLAALEITRKRAPAARDLWVLSLLLIATGLASFYWHGFGTLLGLALDTLSAIVFMLVFAYLWMRRFLPLTNAVLLFSTFFILEILSSLVAYLYLPFLQGFMFVPLAPVIIAFAAWLIYKSAARAARAAWLGFFTIASTLLGLIFRSIDLLICSSFPLGTHFLWHIFVSIGAFLAVLTLLALDRK